MTETAAQIILRWRRDPIAFVRENFRVDPDAWQLEALAKLPQRGIKRISLKACAGPGKTAVLTWSGWWFMACFGAKGEHPKGAAVSVTADNLRDNLWPELAKWQSRSEFLSSAFAWTKERIFAVDHPETWFLAARAFSKTANAEEQGRTLSGLHSKYVFYLIDESGDINPAIGRAAEQGLSNCDVGMILQAGNPTSMDGMLYESAGRLRTQWDVVTITADPDDPKRTPRVPVEYAREQIRLHGRDNPWVMSYILGLFPPGGMNSLLGPDDVEAAMRRSVEHRLVAHHARVLGVDVARFGDDRTVIVPRQGFWIGEPTILRNQTNPAIAAQVALLAKKHAADAIFVDATGGYGTGVIDELRLGNWPVHEVYASGKATDPKYFNKRSECWFLMAEDIKKNGRLPDAPSLLRELISPTYWFHNGKFQLEEKEQIKKRLGFSPDIADAISVSYAQPVMPAVPADDDAGTILRHVRRQQTATMEYDHLAEMRK